MPTAYPSSTPRRAKRRAIIKVGKRPFGITIDAEGRRAYTANVGSNDVSVIDIADGTRDRARARRACAPTRSHSRRAAASSPTSMTAPSACSISRRLKPVKRINVGDYPEGIAATADGRRIIVANWESNSISVIDAAELKVTGEIKVGDGPRAFGMFLRR